MSADKTAYESLTESDSGPDAAPPQVDSITESETEPDEPGPLAPQQVVAHSRCFLVPPNDPGYDSVTESDSGADPEPPQVDSVTESETEADEPLLVPVNGQLSSLAADLFVESSVDYEHEVRIVSMLYFLQSK